MHILFNTNIYNYSIYNNNNVNKNIINMYTIIYKHLYITYNLIYFYNKI